MAAAAAAAFIFQVNWFLSRNAILTDLFWSNCLIEYSSCFPSLCDLSRLWNKCNLENYSSASNSASPGLGCLPCITSLPTKHYQRMPMQRRCPGLGALPVFHFHFKKCLIKKTNNYRRFARSTIKHPGCLGWFYFLPIQVPNIYCTTAPSSLMEEDLLPVLRCCWNKTYQALPFIQQRHGLQPPPAIHPNSPPPQALPAPAWDALMCQIRDDASHKFHKNKYQRLKITKPRPSQTNALSARQERSWWEELQLNLL